VRERGTAAGVGSQGRLVGGRSLAVELGILHPRRTQRGGIGDSPSRPVRVVVWAVLGTLLGRMEFGRRRVVELKGLYLVCGLKQGIRLMQKSLVGWSVGRASFWNNTCIQCDTSHASIRDTPGFFLSGGGNFGLPSAGTVYSS